MQWIFASSEFYNKEDGKYHLSGEGVVKTSAEMVDWYEEMVSKYPIISIEDGLDENDWEGHKLLTERLGKKFSLLVMTSSLQTRKNLLKVSKRRRQLYPDQSKPNRYID